MRKASPGLSCATSTLAFGKSSFHWPFKRSAMRLPVASPPPSSPHGGHFARSLAVDGEVGERAHRASDAKAAAMAAGTAGIVDQLEPLHHDREFGLGLLV